MTLENLIRLLGQLKDEIGNCWVENVRDGCTVMPSEIYDYFAIVKDDGKIVAVAMQKITSSRTYQKPTKKETPKLPGIDLLADLFPDLSEHCPHGEDPADCNACHVQSDLAYDSARERGR